jgi:hypothetical protein
MRNNADGERFQAAFAELKADVSDDPTLLEASWKDSQRLQQLCDELNDLVQQFEAVEDWSRHAFTPNVSAVGAGARRDYDERWRDAVYKVVNRDLLASLDKLFEDLVGEDAGGDTVDAKALDLLGINIEDWKYDAHEEARAIARAFDLAADSDWVGGEIGSQAWDRLTGIAGLDVEGALWRRRAVPHVLVPEHVARHYGANRASLYRRLHQAGKAFVFGAPLAALALQRAVLEEVLKRHWGAESGHVRDANLPELSWDARADRVKNLANDALHRDPEKLRPDQLDRAIIENFLLLRLLIERAPEATEKKR